MKIRHTLLLATAILLASQLPLLAQTSSVFIDILNSKLTTRTHTITANRPMIDLAQTWNAGGVTFTADKINITDSASAAGSLLIDRQIGGASKLKVDKSGNATLAGTTTTTQAVVTSGTLTASAPAFTGTQTWNAGGVTFIGDLLNVTDTASAAGSLLIDRQVAGASKFSVNKSGNLVAAGTGTFTGAVSGAERTDIVQFYPAVAHCTSDTPSASLVAVRIAKGDWALARTSAGAETYNIGCFLTKPFRTTSGKGWKLASFRVAHQITVVDLTSNTFNDLSTVTYVNNTANAIADYGGVVTVTLPTAVQANPYLTAATLGTAAYMNTADAGVNIDWTAVMANTGVYRVYGISATWSEQD